LRSNNLSSRQRLGLAGLLLVGSLVCAVPAMAQTGGSGPPGGTTTTEPTTTTTAPTGTARMLPDGTAAVPANAPFAVQRAIMAANRIHTRPYIWGGGHRSFKSKGYDCSGAVSYVLHAAGLLPTPMDSGSLARRWGAPGIGSWITVYANAGHTFMTIAGLRYDTSAVGESLNQGSGPRWRSTIRGGTGYVARYSPGL
jgi:hypothetical protein